MDIARQTSMPNQQRPHLQDGLAPNPPPNANAHSAERLLHELQVFQVELDMQNEELRRAQCVIEQSRDRYFDFFDFAPVGYITLDCDGMINEVNLTCATLLGIDRHKLVDRRFMPLVVQEDVDRWHRHFLSVLKSNEKKSCEIGLTRADGSRIYVQLDCLLRTHTMEKSVIRVVMTDINERRLVENALRDSKTLLKETQLIAGLGSYILDIQSGIWSSSDLLDQIFGIGKEFDRSIDGWMSLVHPDDRVMMADYFRNGVLAARKNFDKEYRIVRHNDKVERWLHGQGKLRLDAQGHPAIMLGTIQDITDRRTSEILHLLTERQRHLQEQQQIVQTSLDGYWILNCEDGTVLDVNDAVCALVGYSRQELLTMHFGDLEAEKTQAETAARISKIVKKGFERFETVHRHKQGNLINLEVSASYSQMNPGRLSVFVRDITERIQSEMLLRKSSEVIEDLYNNAACGYHSLDRDGIFCRINDTELRWLGYTRDEVIGKINFSDLLVPSAVPAFWESFSRLKKEGVLHDLEQDLVCKDGSLLACLINVTAMYDANGQFVMTRTTVVDITERKKAEKDQKKLTRALKLLTECGSLLIHAVDEQVLLDDICKLAVKTGGYLMAWVGVAENDADKTIRPVSHAGFEEGFLDGVSVTWSETELGLGPTGTAIRTGTTVVNQNYHSNPAMAPWRDAALKRGYESSIALPLRHSNSRVFGVLTIHASEPESFCPEEIAALERLAIDLGFGIEAMRAREAQKSAEQELRELSTHLQTVREEEKASVAREIHDELGSTLAALRMDAKWLSGALPKGEKMLPLHKCLDSMAALLDIAAKATRRMITELRPTMLDDYGLFAAVKWQAGQFQQRTGMECRVTCPTSANDECEVNLDKHCSINLFRIFQEALTNVARHSEASKVDVEFRLSDSTITMSISDNGIGMPEGHRIAQNSYGIRGMRERIEQLGGKIRIDTGYRSGFRVTVRLPLPAATQTVATCN